MERLNHDTHEQKHALHLGQSITGKVRTVSTDICTQTQTVSVYEVTVMKQILIQCLLFVLPK